MPLETAYTPLESLLLFQALRAEASLTSIGFNKISEQLKAVPLIRNAPTFEAGRLNPDALRDLYLRLVKEEARGDVLDLDGSTTDGDASLASRKRKAPSPTLPTVGDAAQHAHLIPRLVSRLYARYREVSVREIRDTERRYDALMLEDAKSRQLSTPASTTTQQPVANSVDKLSSKHGSAAASPRTPHASSDPQPSKSVGRSRIDQPSTKRPQPQNGISDHPRTASGVSVPHVEITPRSPAPNNASESQQHQGTSASNPEKLPSHQQPRGQPPFAGQPKVQKSASHSSPSPRPLATQANARVTSASPVPHAHSPRHPPPIQPHPQQPMLAPHPQTPYQQPHQPNQGYYQQQPGQGYQDRRMSYPLQPAQPQGQYAPHTPHQPGGFQLPPFYFNSGHPIPHHPNGPRGQQAAHYAQPPPGYPPHQPSVPATVPRQIGRPELLKISAALATPPKALWKSERCPRSSDASQNVARPEPEPLSPTLGRAKSPSKSTRPARHVGQQISMEGPVAEAAGRNKRKRADRSPHSVMSAAEASTRAHTRSHSVSTAERPGSSRRKIKNEPSTFDDADDAMDVSATPTSSEHRTRKRRGTTQSQHAPPAKRKRKESPAAMSDTDAEDSPPTEDKRVLATRNFAKLSATVMNDINSHKHASYFAQPVRTKDAAGYNEVIKQPQDLKSIRAAITAGTRTAAAIIAGLESPNETADGSVELWKTVDLIPPKAIVNGSQLEKEVMRMLANAVMFNPGEDGFVADTREMFEDVEAKIDAWRGADRVGEEDEETKGKRRKA